MPRALVLAAGLGVSAVLASPAPVAARGERSIRLPEIRESVPAARTVVRTPAWSRDADAPGETMLAFAPGVVIFASGGRMCGFAQESGAQLWCASGGREPAYARGVVAYGGTDGVLHGVKARNGAGLWRFAFPTSALARSLAGPAMPLAHHAWSIGGSFLIDRYDDRSGRGAPTFGELTPSGRLLWSTEINDGPRGAPVLAPPFVVVGAVGSGATMMFAQYVVRPGLGITQHLGQASNVLGVLPGRLVTDMDSIEPLEDHFLTFDLAGFDLASGHQTAAYHYEPDYDANYARYASNELVSNGGFGHSSVDGAAAYLFIAGNLYRYALAPGMGQRPILLAAKHAYLGGPYLGAVYVTRPDGVWSLRIAGSVVRARLVVRAHTKPSKIAADRGTVYLAFADGTIRGIDAASGATTLAARTCPATRIAVGERRVYVACGAGARWRVVAFAR